MSVGRCVGGGCSNPAGTSKSTGPVEPNPGALQKDLYIDIAEDSHDLVQQRPHVLLILVVHLDAALDGIDHLPGRVLVLPGDFQARGHAFHISNGSHLSSEP